MLDDYKTENIEADAADVEKQQEALLINKLQAQGKNPPKSQSSFLQKKLQQRKFFDSGDYAMNQDKEKKHQRPSAIPAALGGGKKPLPPSVKVPEPSGALPTISPSAGTTTVASPPTASTTTTQAVSPTVASIPPTVNTSSNSDDDEEEHLQIPRPDTVPQRKASILHPSAHSKLSPQPLIHHEHTDDLLSSPQN